MKSLKKGFTLIEVLLGIAIVSFVIVSAFQAISQVSIMKVRLVEKAEINKNIFFSTEKLFEMIKSGGIIDYEEYFNRSQIGTNVSSSTGHYQNSSNFGNVGNFYKCYKINPGDGCAAGTHQKYGEYTFQFIDYDSDGDGDGISDDGDGGITDDDELYGKGPDAISTNKVAELYLIDGLGKRRTYFRWKIITDPDNPLPGTCDTSSVNNLENNCKGNLQYIVLEGKDWGSDHNNAVVDADQYDGVVDTWIIVDSFTGATNPAESLLADPVNVEKHWTNLFPDTMNVTKAQFEIYPKKDIKLQWNNTSTDEVNISPYVRINLKVQPSWITRKHIKGTPPKVELSTTINLNGEYFVNK